MKWEKKEIDQQTVKSIAQQYNLTPLVATILARRGVTTGLDISFFMENDLRFCHNSFLFEDMVKAVERMKQAVEEKEKILVYGDRDVDGVSSTVLVCEAFRRHGIEAEWMVPCGEDTYGLSCDIVQKFADNDGTLIITVDTGISSVEEIALANQLGIDTIILDHHNVDKETPDAVAIINPKNKGTSYPFTGLCGCGVTAKWIWALCFSETDFYNQPMIILHGERIENKNENSDNTKESIRFDLVKMVNLLETKRISLDMLNENAAQQFADFIEGTPLLCFDEKEEKALLRSCFGANAEIYIQGFSEEMGQIFPALHGQSLSELTKRSRLAIYGTADSQVQNPQNDKPQNTEIEKNIPDNNELETIISLFTTFYLKKNDQHFSPFRDALDLTALSTIADQMPLHNENRILVKNGIDKLNSTKREALKELYTALKINDKPIEGKTIGWKISPAINAAGRMGVADLAVKLFLTEVPEERTALASEIAGLNKKRKKLSDDLLDKIHSDVKKSIDNFDGKILLAGNKKILRGISGILAGRLNKIYSLPAIILSMGTSIYSGSIRCDESFNVTALFESLSDILLDYGGHNCAAGFSLNEENYDEFLMKLHKFVKNAPPVKTEQKTIIDAEIPQDYLTLELMNAVDTLAPYGSDFGPPVFMAEKLRILDVSNVGVNHLKLILQSKKHKWPAIYWNSVELYGKTFEKDNIVDVVFGLGINRYMNNETIQMTIFDLKRSKNDY